MKRLELTGQTFGRLKVVGLSGQRENNNRQHVLWLCDCSCGHQIATRGTSLRSGSTKSCGCAKVDQLRARSTRHGLSKTVPYLLWQYAKHRAKVAGLGFNIEVGDVIIPDLCPVFGIPFERNSRVGPLPTSPSIDRISPALGYVKGNVWVISHRANSIKNSASYEQLKAIVAAMEKAALGESVERRVIAA